MNNANFDFLLQLTRKRITKDVMKSIDIAMTLEPYTDAIKELIKISNGEESLAINTMAHDYAGIISKDADFLPRLSKSEPIVNLTPKELEILQDVAALQIEDNFSEYTSIATNSEKGLIGSLVKKGLIFNGYGGNEGEGYMFYLTEKGFEACAVLGISTSHIIVH